LAAADRRARDFGDDLVRLAIGIEDARDLQDDLAQAFAAAAPAAVKAADPAGGDDGPR
ncbi:MAG: PLP-dependent transferase, partial [Phycisphaerales bacterium]|nr:PLP-dependent transferase [Phycisphaerales bacterium]